MTRNSKVGSISTILLNVTRICIRVTRNMSGIGQVNKCYYVYGFTLSNQSLIKEYKMNGLWRHVVDDTVVCSRSSDKIFGIHGIL
mmetsp:Transcript_30160/g.30637  ORF Transcript_30160/g.30637 Transcript_30160/m.30637 type:complete len:85 (-) Transcript_30160:1477-1731(-)